MRKEPYGEELEAAWDDLTADTKPKKPRSQTTGKKTAGKKQKIKDAPQRFDELSRKGEKKMARIFMHYYREDILDLLFFRDGQICQMCRTKIASDDATIDHVVPMSSFVVNRLWNLQVLCQACHERKDLKPKKGVLVWRAKRWVLVLNGLINSVYATFRKRKIIPKKKKP